MDYYGDSDVYACAWMAELIRCGHLPEGKVDEHDIKTLSGNDLAGYRRVHLFAGIGGWAYALQLAGWPADRPVWTGSCPCQPFSVAGKRKAEEDERHLWPVFLRLIRECRPATLFGEQVSGNDGYRWLAGVRDDLEAEGYAVGCADLPACSQAAPHRRSRLFWVAHANGDQSARHAGEEENQRIEHRAESGGGSVVRMANGKEHGRRQRREGAPGSREGIGSARAGERSTDDSGICYSCKGTGLAFRRISDQQRSQCPHCMFGYVEHADHERRQAGAGAGAGAQPQPLGPGQAFWSDVRIIHCQDGKLRRIPAEPFLFPLASGIPGRVGLLRGAGNSIVPQVAAAFIRAYLEAEVTV